MIAKKATEIRVIRGINLTGVNYRTERADFWSLRLMSALSRPLLPTVFALVSSLCDAKGDAPTSPQAGERTYAQSYKDMVLATCIADAYKNDKDAAIDAGSSVSALRDWTHYDLEKSPDAVKSLVDSYLARNYHNPLVESEIKGVRFDFLKCLDLYHSKELDAQVKRRVINPKRTYRQDNPPPVKSK
ncbi:type VI secretion system amidase immunity protein Tai4 [Cupriavidus basilensis]|uniref:type VI secretion system amidase immunity protein Tai4 n=1 Tax=Cupriavidus basilensis TaxID=68895 RepID=UPI0034648D88